MVDNHEPSNTRQNGDNDEQGGTPDSHVETAITRENNEKESHRNTSTARDKFKDACKSLWVILFHRKSGAWAALATIVMAITTIFYTYYARKQWKIIADQLYVMGDANSTTRMTQWAYVDIPQQIEIRNTIENGRVTFWTPEITIVNNGNTGTYITTEVINFYVSDKELPEGFNYPETGKLQTSDLGPHEAEVFEAQPIGIDAIKSIQKGSHVYIYGRVVWWNVFQFYGHAKDRDRKHLREFHYELRLDSSSGDVSDPRYVQPKRLFLYGPHNCTDGDCPDYQEKVEIGTSR